MGAGGARGGRPAGNVAQGLAWPRPVGGAFGGSGLEVRCVSRCAPSIPHAGALAAVALELGSELATQQGHHPVRVVYSIGVSPSGFVSPTKRSYLWTRRYKPCPVFFSTLFHIAFLCSKGLTAWTKEKQWQPLWHDARRMAERLLCATSDEKLPPHFMGAIVLQLQSAKSGQVIKRIVVDGQQRLTTLQLLVRAAQESFQNIDDTQRANVLSKLTLNDERKQVGDSDSDTKVRQANVNDLHSFQDVIRGTSDASRPLRAIGEAYHYFKDEITNWLNEQPANRTARAGALEKTLTEYLQLATVDLDEGEKPHFIFSVLNARAEPLRQSDHIKNTVMYQANVVDDAAKAKELWGLFDGNEWWRNSTKEGRYSRIHLDRFLNYWVVMRTCEEVNAERVSTEFNRFLDSSDLPIDQVAIGIRKAGQVYQDLEEARVPGIGAFLRRVKTMEIGVVMPILMWLYTTDTSDGVRQRGVRALESYLVRRMLCGVSTQGLNRLFVELLLKAEESDPSTADQVIIDFLNGQTVDNRIWPQDSMLLDNLIAEPLRGTVGRQTMVLEAIESHLRSDKTEVMSQGPLTREHIMPESWQRNWPLPDGTSEEEAIQARDQAVKQIGNLTLVTGKLNASLSNAPWHQKRETLAKHTTLRLNWELLEDAPGMWNEGAIANRSLHLAKIAKEIWPSANNI